MLWQRLKQALGAQQPSGAPLPDTELATAVLLYEIARADTEVDESERDTLRHLLEAMPGVDRESAETLLQQAAAVTDSEVSLHDYVGALNRELDAEQRRKLVRMIWQVAYADGVVKPQEEHMSRRIADLLYVPHSVFIQEKLAAERLRAGDDGESQ